MLGLFSFCLFIGSCYSKFDVSVSVLEPFCLNYYYYDDSYYYIPQLQLKFYVVYGDKRSNSYFFQTDFDYKYNYDYLDYPSHFKFYNDENIFPSLFGLRLVLDGQIPLPEVSPDDNLDIRFDINPVYKEDGYTYKKCSSDERLHNHTVVPRSVLHSKARHNVTSPFTIDLSHTTCLTSSESWFYDQTAQIKVQVHFNCHGPCKDIFTPSTTSTTSTTTTSTMTTAASTSSTIQSTTEVTMKPTMTTQSVSTQSQTQYPAADSNKLVIPLALVAVIAVLELIVVVGCAVYILKRIRPNYFKRKKVEPSSVYYDAAVHNVHNELPSAPPQSNEYYMEANDTNEEYVQFNKPARNQDNNESNFADNAIYGQ